MKLFATDYDETLYRNHTITTEDKQAIAAFQAAGNLFGLCSGRHIESLLEEIEKFGLDVDFIIANNGTAILNKNHELLFMTRFEKSLVLKIRDYFQKHLTNQVYYLAANNGYTFGRDIYQSGYQFMVDHTTPLEAILDGEVSTLFTEAIDPSHSSNMIQKANEYFQGEVTFYQNNPFIDIVQTPITKADGVHIIAQHYQIPVENVFVAGDSYNDITMLKEFNSFGMSTGAADAIGYADEKVESIEQALNRINQKHL